MLFETYRDLASRNPHIIGSNLDMLGGAELDHGIAFHIKADLLRLCWTLELED